MSKRTVTTIHIDEDLLERVDQQAEWSKRSRSDFIEIELAKLFGRADLIPEAGEPPNHDERKMKI